MANILDNIGQVLVGTIVLPPLLSGKTNSLYNSFWFICNSFCLVAFFKARKGFLMISINIEQSTFLPLFYLFWALFVAIVYFVVYYSQKKV